MASKIIIEFDELSWRVKFRSTVGINVNQGLNKYQTQTIIPFKK